MKIPRARYTLRGLMVVVALAAVVFALTTWALRPKPFPVSGTVTCNGQPVANGKIVFVPPTPAGQQAVGQIVSGKYSLTTFTTNDGALPGPYTIVIVSPSVPVKFQSQSTSMLTIMVQKSSNMIDFSLVE